MAGVRQLVEQVTCLKLLVTPLYGAFSVREGKYPKCCNGLWPSKATGHKQVYGVSLLLIFTGEMIRRIPKRLFRLVNNEKQV